MALNCFADTTGDEEKKDPLADTNMEMYNSPLAKKVRKSAAEKEPAWKGAGQEEGVVVWRIEQFNVVAWPKKEYGKFFQGDSYIVLETYKPDPNEANLDYRVYFWLGKESTQDEFGTAAYKTVELDTFLGGEPVQYREVQDHESPEWKSVFPKMTIMAGGAKGGFNKVKPEEYEVRLMHVAGKGKKVKINQIKTGNSNISSCDCYVLDAGLDAFVFFGPNANVWEKTAANKFVDELQGERGKLEDHNVDGLDDDSDSAKKFWELLGGKPDGLCEKFEPEEEKWDVGEKKVYKISDNDGNSVTMTEMDAKPDDAGLFSKDVLCTTDIFLVYDGEIAYLWMGKGASAKERKFAMPIICETVKEFERTPFRRVCEGKETKAFKKLFSDF